MKKINKIHLFYIQILKMESNKGKYIIIFHFVGPKGSKEHRAEPRADVGEFI